MGKTLTKSKKKKVHHYASRHKSTDGIPKMTPERKKYINENYESIIENSDYAHIFGKRVGAPKVFEDPNQMAAAAVEYFNWCRVNPWNKQEWKDKGIVSIPMGRVFTLEGCCLWMGTTSSYFRNFRFQLKDTDKLAPEFKTVIGKIEEVIRTQKFEGAAVGAYNANLIAYDLGLKRDVGVSVSGEGITINVIEEDSKELLETVRRKLEEIDKMETKV